MGGDRSPVAPLPRRGVRVALLLALLVAGLSASVLVELGGSTPRGGSGAVEVASDVSAELSQAAATAPPRVPADGMPPAVSSAGGGDGGDDPGGSAEMHFALGRDLARRNVADAPGASKQGLEQARAEFAAALRLGYGDRAAAQRLLAQTYASLAHDWASTSEEKRLYDQGQREARREVVALSPADADARYEYAVLLEDRRLRIEELGEAIRRAPRDPRPRRALGEDLLEEGEPEEGARQLVEAAELFDREQLELHGPTIRHLLRYHGREQEEERVREWMEKVGL